MKFLSTYNRRLNQFPPFFSPGEIIKDCVVRFIAEFLGTAILMFCGCLCGMQFKGSSDTIAGPLGFGFTVCMIISIFGIHSGAHLNPSVTLCAVLYGSLPSWVSRLSTGNQILSIT